MRYLQISPSLIKVSLRKMELHYSVIGFWWPAMQQEMNWSRSLSFYQTICMHTTFLFIPFGGSGLWIWFNLISSYLIYIEIFKEVIVFSLRVVKLGNILTFSIQFMCSFFYSNEKEDKVLLKIVLSRLCWGQCYLHNLVLGASPYFTFIAIIITIVIIIVVVVVVFVVVIAIVPSLRLVREAPAHQNGWTFGETQKEWGSSPI